MTSPLEHAEVAYGAWREKQPKPLPRHWVALGLGERATFAVLWEAGYAQACAEFERAASAAIDRRYPR